jgi:hypothetical protein
MSRGQPRGAPYHRDVADVQPSQIRIGDTERESALTALGEHMSAGRLDIDEYGDRTARVATAKTRGDLTGLFGDLPQPHPRFGAAPQPAAPAPSQQVAPAQGRSPAMRQRLAAIAIPLAGILALALLFTGHWWLIFILPGVLTMFGRRYWGDNSGYRQRMNRDRQRDLRRRGRDW